MAALAVAEGAAQSAHLDLEIRFFDVRFRPGSGDQLLLADHFAGAFDQSGQNVEGAAAEPHRLVALDQEPLRCKEPVRAKRDRVFVQGAGRRTHSQRFGHSRQDAVRGHGQSSLAPQISLREVDDLVATAADHGFQHVKSFAIPGDREGCTDLQRLSHVLPRLRWALLALRARRGAIACLVSYASLQFRVPRSVVRG
jgi:hypothetical protein